MIPKETVELAWHCFLSLPCSGSGLMFGGEGVAVLRVNRPSQPASLVAVNADEITGETLLPSS